LNFGVSGIVAWAFIPRREIKESKRAGFTLRPGDRHPDPMEPGDKPW
jgi:hypothetical protein